MFFGPAVASFTYLSTFLFTSHSTAQNVILFQNFVTGLCLMITSFILGLFDSTRLINMQLKNMYRLFPGFCLGDGLIQLTLCVNDECPTLAETGYTFEKQSVWAWDVIGGDLTFLICEMVIYLAITMAIEYSLSFPSVLAMFTKCFTTDPGLIANSHDCGDDDADVAAEADTAGTTTPANDDFPPMLDTTSASRAVPSAGKPAVVAKEHFYYISAHGQLAGEMTDPWRAARPRAHNNNARAAQVVMVN